MTLSLWQRQSTVPTAAQTLWMLQAQEAPVCLSLVPATVTLTPDNQNLPHFAIRSLEQGRHSWALTLLALVGEP